MVFQMKDYLWVNLHYLWHTHVFISGPSFCGRRSNFSEAMPGKQSLKRRSTGSLQNSAGKLFSPHLVLGKNPQKQEKCLTALSSVSYIEECCEDSKWTITKYNRLGDSNDREISHCPRDQKSEIRMPVWLVSGEGFLPWDCRVLLWPVCSQSIVCGGG